MALSAGWSRRSGAGVSARPSALIGAASTLPIHWHGPATSGREAFAASKTTSTNRWTSVRGRGWRRGARPLPPGTSAARATCLRRAQCGHEACRRCRRSPPAPHGGHGWVRVACAVANWSAWATTRARAGRQRAARTARGPSSCPLPASGPLSAAPGIPGGGKTVALTFDDGPGPSTPAILVDPRVLRRARDVLQHRRERDEVARRRSCRSGGRLPDRRSHMGPSRT